jgi:hypothetical protein
MLWAIAGILAIGISVLIYNSWKKRRNDESSIPGSEDEEEDEDEELLEN